MTKKASRKKWSVERAKALEAKRITTPLTYKALAEQEGMTAQAIKASIQKYLKKATVEVPKAEPQTDAKDTKNWDNFLENARAQMRYHRRMTEAFETILFNQGQEILSLLKHAE